MNLRYTFRVHGSVIQRMFLFVMINTSNLILVELFEFFFIEHLKAPEWFSIMMGMGWYIPRDF